MLPFFLFFSACSCYPSPASQNSIYELFASTAHSVSSCLGCLAPTTPQVTAADRIESSSMDSMRMDRPGLSSAATASREIIPARSFSDLKLSVAPWELESMQERISEVETKISNLNKKAAWELIHQDIDYLKSQKSILEDGLLSMTRSADYLMGLRVSPEKLENEKEFILAQLKRDNEKALDLKKDLKTARTVGNTIEVRMLFQQLKLMEQHSLAYQNELRVLERSNKNEEESFGYFDTDGTWTNL